ncbi:MAG: phosphoribosylanthranilate isomerase [Zavarzinella sp.]
MTRIKICGITTTEDARFCEELGVDALGLNFYPPSPRYIAPKECAGILNAVSPLISLVGVFVDTPVNLMTALAYQLGLRGVQIHGKLPTHENSFPFGLIPAFRVREQADIDQIHKHLEHLTSSGNRPSAIIVDGFHPEFHGGSGITAPWDLLAGQSFSVPLILAGGLTPENVAQAISIVRPFAVDVASGVESAPGKKDRRLLQQFVTAVRSVSDANRTM